MPSRYPMLVSVAFVLVFLYFVFPISPQLEDTRPPIPFDAVETSGGTYTGNPSHGSIVDVSSSPDLNPEQKPGPVDTIEVPVEEVQPIASVEAPEPTTAVTAHGEVSQAQFDNENDALGLEWSAGKIYGSSLNELTGVGNHAGFVNAALTPTDSRTPYNNAPPFIYSPYPEYNNKAWKSTNKGQYVACNGPDGKIGDVLVFSGHPLAFEYSPIGSWTPLGIDSNLCFERQTRLEAYGYTEHSTSEQAEARRSQSFVDWDSVNWGQLQSYCIEKNAGRYIALEEKLPINNDTLTNGSDSETNATTSNFEEEGNLTRDIEADVETEVSDDLSMDEAEAKKLGLHRLAKSKIGPKPRTAILLRSYTGKNYMENDRQNMRSLITELSLRSGGEYQVYLLVQIKESDIPRDQTNTTNYRKLIESKVPKEFWDIVVAWDDKTMRAWYPKLPSDINNVHQSQWLSVQKFGQEHPQFDYFWNWELDSRYTGHYYNLLEKLAEFGAKQPRKGLWERNERFYIPSLHAEYYDSKFRTTVQELSGEDSVWGAPSVANFTQIGPGAPVETPMDDDYRWGVGEDADLITLAPIFNPVNTTWPGRNDVWGYDGPEATPRRATIGTQSRVSKTLLNAMHLETKKGNHFSSEMAPMSVALLHGLKAVYAPIPVYFDRAWDGKQLDKYFNPGPKGVSGSTEESPFSWGRESRFGGSTWYYRATPPKRLYNNWMGWDDTGIGGPDWEKVHGRMCLPPILLHPIKDVVRPLDGFSSKSELPY
ncbi:hypothetical protein BJ878DRAFT_477990 [Calycina marina]|uniref:Major facilitator superfamily transporter n=1 Tax=Calycina marina TaxID=1763456 RepID=A0A9P7Z7Y3_9HELO|nr:hypothetical protein BJ878DRAFT_477990 [Calycina marina]